MSNRIIFGLLLSMSSTATYTSVIPTKWEESDEGILQIEGSGQYLKQSSNVIDVFFKSSGDVAFLPSYYPAAFTEPNYDWGFGIELAYIFPEVEYDIRANYKQLRSDKSQNLNTEPLSTPFGPLTSDLHQTYNFNFTAADLTIGNYFDFCDRALLRLGYGITYVDIEQKTNALFSFTPSFIEEILGNDATMKNTFEGFGLKGTADGQYELLTSLSFVGSLGLGVLYGDSHWNITLSYPNLTAPNKVKEDKYVFEIDGKAGLNFAVLESDGLNFQIEAGYQALYYPNSLTEKKTHDGSTTTTTKNDYYNYGPYASLTLNYR